MPRKAERPAIVFPTAVLLAAVGNLIWIVRDWASGAEPSWLLYVFSCLCMVEVGLRALERILGWIVDRLEKKNDAPAQG